MPIYRYRCEDCETVFSALEFAGDPATGNCENCSSTQIERIPSVPGVQFKGKGFYATDKRSRSKKSEEPSKKDTSNNNDSKSSNNDGKTSSGKSEAVTSEK